MFFVYSRDFFYIFIVFIYLAAGSKQFVIAAAVDKENVAAAARKTTPKTKAAVALIAVLQGSAKRKMLPSFPQKASRGRQCSGAD